MYFRTACGWAAFFLTRVLVTFCRMHERVKTREPQSGRAATCRRLPPLGGLGLRNLLELFPGKRILDLSLKIILKGQSNIKC